MTFTSGSGCDVTEKPIQTPSLPEGNGVIPLLKAVDWDGFGERHRLMSRPLAEDWHEFYLQTPEGLIPLGHDSPSAILRRLVSTDLSKADENGMVLGQGFFVLHSCLYLRRDSAGQLTVVVHDRDAHVVYSAALG